MKSVGLLHGGQCRTMPIIRQSGAKAKAMAECGPRGQPVAPVGQE